MPRDPRLDPQSGDVVECRHEGNIVTVKIVSVYATDYDVNIDVTCSDVEKRDTITIFDWWDINRVQYPEFQLEQVGGNWHTKKWLVELTGRNEFQKRPVERKFICDSVADIVEKLNIKAE